jgi:hypothetical protein
VVSQSIDSDEVVDGGKPITGCAEELGHGGIANFLDPRQCPETVSTESVFESIPMDCEEY